VFYCFNPKEEKKDNCLTTPLTILIGSYNKKLLQT